MGEYDVGQICMNGHVINSSSQGFPEFNKDFCDECGEKTIVNCPHCNQSIRGQYRPGVVLEWLPPKYCDKCGKRFPWTESRMMAAIELAAEAIELEPADREALENNLPNVIVETPRMELALSRIIKIRNKLKGPTGNLMSNILANLICDAGKNMLQ